MNSGFFIKLMAWGIALTLVALPMIGVLNGWFAADRWPVRDLILQAEFNHTSAEQIRATVATHLGDGFFAVNLDEVRKAVASLPWVERVDASKRWPDTLELTVYEQQPYAHWGEQRLVDRSGKIFKVPGAETIQGLPQLSGPDERLGEVLAFYADCLRRFSGAGLVVTAVILSERGSWRVQLAEGAIIEIGHDDIQARLDRFLGIWPRLTAAHSGAPAYVDLRYANGFALRWADSKPPPLPATGEGGAHSTTGEGNHCSDLQHPPCGDLLPLVGEGIVSGFLKHTSDA